MIVISKVPYLRHTLKQKAPLSALFLKCNYSSAEQTHYDVVIAGGGMVGTTLACTLGKNKKFANKKILLLEGSKEFKWQPAEKYSNRVVALNPQTHELFKSIGAWQHIASNRFGVVKKMQVWDGISDSMITFSNNDFENPIAYIVENDLVLSSVDKETKNLPNVSVVNEAKIKSYHLADHENSSTKVSLENGQVFSCDLLLGCDGAKSQVREAMGGLYLSWDYQQMGVVATLKLTEAADNFVAWQRFLPTGPIALLPLKENLSSLVWSTTTAHAKELLTLTDEQFVQAVNDAVWKSQKKEAVVTEATKLFDNFIKSFNLPSNAVRQLPPNISGIEEKSRAAFPLGFGHATIYVKQGVALLGDAAHRVHPLAGQGVNLGFGDIVALNRILGESIYSGSKLGDLSYLKQYETDRQRHNVPTMFAIEGLHRLYTTEFTPIVLLRSVGLQLTNALEPIKKSIISQGAA